MTHLPTPTYLQHLSSLELNEWLLDVSKSDVVDAKKPRVNQTAGEKVVVTTFSFFKAELSKALSPILDVG